MRILLVTVFVFEYSVPAMSLEIHVDPVWVVVWVFQTFDGPVNTPLHTHRAVHARHLLQQRVAARGIDHSPGAGERGDDGVDSIGRVLHDARAGSIVSHGAKNHGEAPVHQVGESLGDLKVVLGDGPDGGARRLDRILALSEAAGVMRGGRLNGWMRNAGEILGRYDGGSTEMMVTRYAGQVKQMLTSDQCEVFVGSHTFHFLDEPPPNRHAVCVIPVCS